MRYFCSLCFCLVLNCYDSSAQDCAANPPYNLTVSELTSCSATLSWSSNSGGKFKVSYKVSSTSQWKKSIKVGTDTSYTFTGLEAGTKYYLRVFSKCADGTKSAFVKIVTTTLACMQPDSVSILGQGSNAVNVTLESGCSYDSVHVRYRTLNTPFIYQTFSTAAFYSIDQLNSDSMYLFQVSTCLVSDDTWSAIDTVKLTPDAPAALPNIVFILIDDSRYDYFSCNGAPSFFQTPNIDRIAREGVNFTHSYCVSSLCAPSRASIATGLFTQKTGVLENGVPLDTSFYTIPEVLRDHGYYTALVGKNHGTFLNGVVPEFDYYLWMLGTDKNEGKKFDYNGVRKTIDKEHVLTLTDTAIAIINRTNDPLFMWLAYKVPHIPLTPLPSFEGRYDNETIPLAPDTAKYTINYPSFTYQSLDELIQVEDLIPIYRDVLEVIGGLDSCVGKIIEALEANGKLDNTLLIFTDDNGYMLGNHMLKGKTVAYEPSIRIPMFIRYPKWFTDSTVIDDQFVLNLDLAPTMYEAAGITFNGPLDGISMKKLYDREVIRNEMFYFMRHSPSSILPTKRAVRDQQYKLIHHSCIVDTVEELFDMVNDPLELTNLVNNQAYASILVQYQQKLDSSMIAWEDTFQAIPHPCYISNPLVLREALEDDVLPEEPVIHPTITSGSVEVYIPWTFAEAVLFDDVGRHCGEWELTEQFSRIELPDVVNGLYFLGLNYKGITVTKKLIVSR